MTTRKRGPRKRKARSARTRRLVSGETLRSEKRESSLAEQRQQAHRRRIAGYGEVALLDLRHIDERNQIHRIAEVRERRVLTLCGKRLRSGWMVLAEWLEGKRRIRGRFCCECDAIWHKEDQE